MDLHSLGGEAVWGILSSSSFHSFSVEAKVPLSTLLRQRMLLERLTTRYDTLSSRRTSCTAV